MISERIKTISYAIREIAAVANEVAKSGKKIYRLNIGDPVIYDFHTPKYISQALGDASLNGNSHDGKSASNTFCSGITSHSNKLS